MAFVGSYCGHSLLLDISVYQVFNLGPTLMTSFRFDIRQCLSFPTYEIWSLVTTGVRNLFTMFFSIQKRSFCKGSSESIEENHMHLTTT